MWPKTASCYGNAALHAKAYNVPTQRHTHNTAIERRPHINVPIYIIIAQFNYTSGTSQALQTSAHAKLQDAATWRIELHDPRASVRLLWMFHDDRSDVNVDSAR